MLEVMDHCFKETVSIKGLWVIKDKTTIRAIAPYLGEVPHCLNILRSPEYAFRNLAYSYKHPNKKSIFDIMDTNEFATYSMPAFNNNSIGMYFPSKVNTTNLYSGVLRQPHEYDCYNKQLIIFRHPGEAKAILEAVFNNEEYEGFASADYIMR